jgi:hypothetical protein
VSRDYIGRSGGHVGPHQPDSQKSKKNPTAESAPTQSLARGHGSPSTASAPPPQRIRGGTSRGRKAGFAGRSAPTTLKLFQERGEMFRDGVVDRIVPGPEHLPDFPQPWASAQDVARFG